MPKTTWEVAKATGSYADALAAVGLADLISDLTQAKRRSRQVVAIKDRGDCYEVVSPVPLEASDVKTRHISPGYPFFKAKATDTVPAGAAVFDYEAARAKEKVYRDFQKSVKSTKGSRKKGKAEQALEAEGLQPPATPPVNLQVYKVFNAMRMGSDAYNKVHAAILDAPDIGSVVAGRLGLSDAAVDEAPFTKAAASLQLFNPASGKGINRAKPDSTALGGIPDRFVDWFLEWAKFRAMNLALAAWSVGDDTKVMVLAPRDIDVDNLSGLRSELLGSNLWGSVSLDIRAALTLAELLIQRSEEFRGGEGRVRFDSRAPNQVVAGLYTAYFKSLGTASAVMNLSFLGLPGWFPVTDRKSAEEWLALLDEHRKCIGSLDETHSDDVAPLLAYRDYLSSGNLKEALDFFALYAARLMQKKAQNKYAMPFTTDGIRRLFMSEVSLRDIIENEGFQAVAAAVRRSTIKGQIRKSITGRNVFDIKYGLAQDWKRKAKHRNEFVKELSDFVQAYNHETARHAEQRKETRPYLNTKHLEELLGLIRTDHDSELVGMLLLAYGYALEPKEASNPAEVTEE